MTMIGLMQKCNLATLKTLASNSLKRRVNIINFAAISEVFCNINGLAISLVL